MNKISTEPYNLAVQLQQAKLFSHLSTADLERVADLSIVRYLNANQLALAAGAKPAEVAVLLAGGLHVLDRQEDDRLCHVGTLQPGDSIGWIGAIDSLPTNSHIVATVSGAWVLLVPLPVIQALFAQRPAFSRAVMNLLASTIRHYMRSRFALSAPSVAQRIYRVIAGLAEDAAAHGTVVLPKQQDLASLANTSRETVSRTLQELIKHGVLDKKGHQISIRDLAALQQLASGVKL